jgi:acyl-CoA thioesterase-1
MGNLCKILCFGDSLTKGYASIFEEQFKRVYPDIDVNVINAGIGGEMSKDGLKRLSNLVESRPSVVLLGFGMNDWAQGVTLPEFESNLCQMISAFEEVGARVLLLTLNPVGHRLFRNSGNVRIDIYNNAIKDVAYKKRIRIVDINSLWKKEIKPWHKGLRDNIHPNELGYELYCKALLRVIPRRSIIILWQYNGNPCQCNYNCPYCSYEQGRIQKGHFFEGTIESWRKAFKNMVGKQHLVLYFGHGEPMIGRNWFDIVEMVGSEPNWEMRVITNLSTKLDKLLNSKVAKEGRLNINASFHPTETTREELLEKLLKCRKANIEVPVVYTMWPPFFERFENDFHFFDKHNFLVHVRRFRGRYKGKTYPRAYTEEQRRLIAKYSDDATIKYMLVNESTYQKHTWAGVDFFIVDNKGDVGYCDDFRPDQFNLGNIFKENFKAYTSPHPFPGRGVSDGTVDGVANILELGYKQLEGNHIFDFAQQGGVYRMSEKVFYKNFHTDFNNPRVRAEYRFPPRNFVDCYYTLLQSNRSLSSKFNQIFQFLVPSAVIDIWTQLYEIFKRSPGVRRFYKYLFTRKARV